MCVVCDIIIFIIHMISWYDILFLISLYSWSKDCKSQFDRNFSTNVALKIPWWRIIKTHHGEKEELNCQIYGVQRRRARYSLYVRYTTKVLIRINRQHRGPWRAISVLFYFASVAFARSNRYTIYLDRIFCAKYRITHMFYFSTRCSHARVKRVSRSTLNLFAY